MEKFQTDPYTTLQIQVDQALMAFQCNVKTIKHYRIIPTVARNKYNMKHFPHIEKIYYIKVTELDKYIKP